MPASMTPLVATAAPAIVTILGLLIACFGAIFAMAMFARVVFGPGRRVALLIGAALVVLAAIVLLSGAPPGGRAVRARSATARVKSGSEPAPPRVDAASPHHERLALEAERFAQESRASVEEQTRELIDRVRPINAPETAAENSTVVITLSGGYPTGEGPVPPPTIDAPKPPTIRSESRSMARELRTKSRSMARELRRWVRNPDGGWIVRTLVTALALAAFLYVGYLFLDAGTRGQFTWSLRIVSLLAFAVFLAALARWSIH